jgi:hypothetical protein
MTVFKSSYYDPQWWLLQQNISDLIQTPYEKCTFLVLPIRDAHVHGNNVLNILKGNYVYEDSRKFSLKINYNS